VAERAATGLSAPEPAGRAALAQVYHAGVNTRPVRRALQGLFAGDLGKDVVRPAWRKTR
jgi:predicted unusual protein kinase regulating ubiquinone biosynthesis (AarF/ABC1/UbiB family)